MWINKLLNGGLGNNNFSISKIRAIKISNVIAFSAVMNCFIFGMVFFYFGDLALVKGCFWAGILYFLTWGITLIGYPDLGRPLNLISGNLVIFWFACYMRGESLLQLFFFSLAVLPFMYFSWEERSRYWLVLLSVFLLILGEANNYMFFTGTQYLYDLRLVRIFSLLAPLSQIFIGFLYFLKQSVRFEQESQEHLKELELEHKKQVQTHKMTSLGEMAAGMAHEINNPLMVILGLTYKLGSKTEIEITPIVNRIESTVNRIAKIVQALKDFSRNASQDKMELTAIRKIVDSTLMLCRERFTDAGIEIQEDVDENLKIFCRSTEISQVLFNLLNNSYDAITNIGEHKGWIKITAKKYNEDFIEIRVIDSNPGIPSSLRDRLMEPFFTTKEVGKGMGLGLSISKGIIQGHQGSLNYLPEEKNTTFQILLPAVKFKASF